MDLFGSKLMNRISLWKSIGFVFWLGAFCLMPLFFTEASLMLQWALFLWYTTLWSFIWVFGVWTKHPLFPFHVSYWLRWIFIWAWMNFLLALFMYNDLVFLLQWTYFEWWSPFWIVLEWAIFWLIVDFIATKYIWEGKELMN